MLKTVVLSFLFVNLVSAENVAIIDTVRVSTNGSCMAEVGAEDIRSDISENVRELLLNVVIPSLGCRSGECAGNPASSCAAIYARDPLLESGDYWIRRCDGVALQVYCEMDGSRFSSNQPGGWMRMAYLNTSKPDQTCPYGLTIFEESGIRTCARTRSNVCISQFYDTNFFSYSQVCGRIIGYQDGSPDAFEPYFSNQDLTIDDDYVDGVSITYGHSPRKHIWTFAAAVDEPGATNMYRCPCTNNDTVFTGVIPPFVGQDYFCDTGSRNGFQFIFYPNDPLWDGAGCGPTSTCCTFNNPPWFCQQLPQPTTDHIEVRFCGNQNLGDENVPVGLIEIYVI